MEIDLDRLIALLEVADTAALNLWYNGEEMEGIRSFVARVHAALALRCGGGIALDSFFVSFNYDDCFASDVDSWLDFAAKNQVKNISLFLKDDCCNPKLKFPMHTYSLSQIIYSNSSLTELRLQNCCIALSPQVEWRSLRRLWQESVKLPQQAIGEIVFGCPFLETLDLDWCYGFDRLEIGGRSFRRLKVKSCKPLLEISAPYMRDLQITVYYCSIGRNLRLRDVSSVESAYIDFTALNWRSSSSISEEMMPCAMELFQGLRHVKKLDLSRDCTRIVSLMALLESSPHLETLQLFGCMSMLHVDGIKWGSTTRNNLTCDLIHLKTVDIKFSHKSKFSVKLEKMLLKRAPLAKIN